MAVLEQITDQISEASGKFFDVATNTNDKAHGKTKEFVTKIKDGDVKLPLADKLSDIELPLADKLPEIDLPEPLEAVDSTFGLIGKGIEANRKLTMKAIDLLRGEDEVIETTAKPKAAPKKPAAKKPAAKKATTAKKTAAKKPAAKKTSAKKASTKKA